MFNLREDFGELYSQVNELYPEETHQRISEVISVLIDEGYSDAAITCFFDTQDALSIEEKYISISESYEVPEQNVDRINHLYQEGWAGRLAKNLLKHGKTIGKSSKNFVTGGKKVAGKVGDDVVKPLVKTSKGNTVTGSNWTSGANPAGKPAAKLTNDSLGKQMKDTATAAKKGIKNNKWGTAAAATVGAGIGLGAVTGGEDANKKAMEKLKKDKAELDKQMSDTGSSTPKTDKAIAKQAEPPKPVPLVGDDDKKKEKAPEKKKANVPDGIARGITGAMDLATNNMTDFDQRGGKPIGLARIVTGIADKLTGDRYDFDKRGASKLNAGQKSERDKNYVKKSETPKTTTDSKPTDSKPDPSKGASQKFADAIKLATQISKDKSSKQPKADPKPTNPSGKVLPTPNPVRPGSAKERMISKNIETHGAKNVSHLRSQHAAWKAARNKGSGYTMDDFVKDFPNSNTAKDRRKDNRSLHPDLNKVLGRESYEAVLEDYDAYDIVLNYLLETNQANTIEEANYVMLEMDSPTIKDIVWEHAVNEGNVSRHSKTKLDPPETKDGVNYPYDIKKDPKYQKGGIAWKAQNNVKLDPSDYSRGGLPLNPKQKKVKEDYAGGAAGAGAAPRKSRPAPSAPSGPKTGGPSGPRTGGPSGPRTGGPSGPRTGGPSGPRTGGPSGPKKPPSGPKVKDSEPSGPKTGGPSGPRKPKTDPAGPRKRRYRAL